MNINDYKTMLEDIVHSKLYTSSKSTKEQKRNWWNKNNGKTQ